MRENMTMTLLLLTPPIAFIVVGVFVWIQYRGMKILSAGETWPEQKGKYEAYACGEDVQNHKVKPDYSEFFPFAFFFTIMHVVALVVATMPGGMANAILAAGYLLSAVIALFVLFRR